MEARTPMKLHTVVISYNRPELTKQAIESYVATVTLPYTLTVVDNASGEETRRYLSEAFADGFIDEIIFLPENKYPGYACNEGWSMAPDDATHFHRADNDFIFLPNWCVQVEKMFRKGPKLGQLGMRTDAEELFAPTNVGGNCVIRREVWEEGVRWDERPWPQLRDEVGAGWTEDSLMSIDIESHGWLWNRVKQPCIQPISPESAEDPYYQQTWADRGIHV